MRRIKETEEKHLKYLEKRWDEREEIMLEFFAVAIGLAHHNLYGKNKDQFIEPFIREWNKQVDRIFREELTYPELRQELYDKTEVSFDIVRE